MAYLMDRLASEAKRARAPPFRLDGTVWTTDKDGIILALLAAEITAKMGKDPGKIYQELTDEFGAPAYGRVEAPATRAQKAILKHLSAQNIQSKELAGEKSRRFSPKPQEMALPSVG